VIDEGVREGLNFSIDVRVATVDDVLLDGGRFQPMKLTEARVMRARRLQ
jgi:hypothetical protein